MIKQQKLASEPGTSGLPLFKSEEPSLISLSERIPMLCFILGPLTCWEISRYLAVSIDNVFTVMNELVIFGIMQHSLDEAGKPKLYSPPGYVRTVLYECSAQYER